MTVYDLQLLLNTFPASAQVVIKPSPAEPSRLLRLAIFNGQAVILSATPPTHTHTHTQITDESDDTQSR